MTARRRVARAASRVRESPAIAYLGGTSAAESLVPVQLGKQWPGGQPISGRFDAPGTGRGSARFPNGAEVHALAWQSAVKVNAHEVLLVLLASPFGRALDEPGALALLSSHTM